MFSFKELAIALIIILIIFGAGKLPLAFKQISEALKSSKKPEND